MRVNVMSDLHLDFADLELPGGDVLILSGDICEAKRYKKDMYDPEFVLLPGERLDHRPDRFARFFEEECAKYREVIYVMGNHEHYGYQLQKTAGHIRNQLPSNVHLLERDCYTIDDVTFVGATLWTDMNNHDALTLFHMKSMMSDYKQITMHNEVKQIYHRLTPERTVEEHMKTKQYIQSVVAGKPDQKFVVVTHHAPSRMSTAEYYKHDTIMNGAYSSDLSEFILDHPQIRVWTHGHTHDPFDYMIGDTRVVCNPRGYAGYESRANEFDPSFGFDI